jgi:hypothetical protein
MNPTDIFEAHPLEKRMAEALAYIRTKKAERLRSAAAE